MEYPYHNKAIEDMPGEVWKEIEGFSGNYLVSSCGRIKSADRYVNHKSGKPILIKSKILSQSLYKHRNLLTNDDIVALRVGLSQENKRYDYQVRRLVYQAFIGSLNPELYIINLDGDGFNNRVENLEAVTKSQKQVRSIERERHVPSLKYLDRSKFTGIFGGYSRQRSIGQYDMEGNLIKEFKSIAEAVRQTGHDEKSIITVAKGRWSHHHGYVWKYM